MCGWGFLELASWIFAYLFIFRCRDSWSKKSSYLFQQIKNLLGDSDAITQKTPSSKKG